MQRSYEVMYIVRPDVTDEDLDKLVSGFESTVAGAGGAVSGTERIGKRRLAYVVRKFNEGNYNLLRFSAEGGLVHEVERRLRVSEPVIKFITVRVDEEQKRLAKIKAIRDTKVRRSNTAPAEGAPVEVPAPVVATEPGAEQAPAQA